MWRAARFGRRGSRCIVSVLDPPRSRAALGPPVFAKDPPVLAGHRSALHGCLQLERACGAFDSDDPIRRKEGRGRHQGGRRAVSIRGGDRASDRGRAGGYPARGEDDRAGRPPRTGGAPRAGGAPGTAPGRSFYDEPSSSRQGTAASSPAPSCPLRDVWLCLHCARVDAALSRVLVQPHRIGGHPMLWRSNESSQRRSARTERRLSLRHPHLMWGRTNTLSRTSKRNMSRRPSLFASFVVLLCACTNTSSTDGSSHVPPSPSAEPTGLGSAPGSAAGPTTPAPTPTSAATAEPTASAAQPDVLAGTWTSPSCGERKYERELTFSADGTYAARDLVSPCPKGVACVWSGIVERKGTWTVSGADVALADAKPKQKSPGQPFPSALKYEGGKLVELAGTESCGYSRR